MNQNRKEIAHEKNDGEEVDYICNRYGIEKDIVESVMLSLNGKGKYARSRRKIYAALIETGYMVKPIRKIKDIDTSIPEGKLLVFAIGRLMEDTYKDKSFSGILSILNKINKISPKPPKQEQIFTAAEYFKP